MAGHSVGEVTAAAAAGILSETDAVAFVRERGQAMAAAAALATTGMSAVIGGDEDELLARLAELGLSPANFNGGGQIVVAGALDALAELQANPIAGARVIPLQVAGAFHTSYMEPAVAHLDRVRRDARGTRPDASDLDQQDGNRSSRSGAPLRRAARRPGLVAGTVGQDHGGLRGAGVTGIIELAPAGALVGLAKRGLKGVPSVAVKTPDDLAAAFDLIDGK